MRSLQPFQGHTSSRPQQSGQALLLGLMLLAVCVALLLMLARTGTQLSVRERLVGAADASAYSAAVWRARVLNSLAYSNRTIVAQEVAIAQAVTLAAWARYFETLAGSAELLASAYPPAAAVLAYAGQAASLGADLSDQAMRLEVGARGGAGPGLAAMLETGQVLLLRSANNFGLSAVANEVAQAYDRRFSAFTLTDQGHFAGFVRRQTGDVDRARFRDVVTASLDGFTGGDRDRDLRLPLPSGCVGRSSDLDRWTLWFRKRGSTGLSDDLQTWQAVDAASIHDSRGRGLLGLGRCRDLEALPVGWGAAGGSSRSDGGQGSVGIPTHSAAATVNPEATALALLDQGAAGRTGAYRGLATIHDLADRDSPYPVTRVAVLARAEREPSKADRSVVRIFPTGQPDAAFVPLQQMWALAAAEVYFRPPPPSQRIEYASLYSPFWQVRLVEVTPAEREEAQRHAR
jgi:hypothetical protein